jgi:hypothetical protein
MITTFDFDVAAIQERGPLWRQMKSFFKGSSPPGVYLQNGIAYPFPNATTDSAPRSNESVHARLVNVVGYFDRMWYGCAPRRCRRHTRRR